MSNININYKNAIILKQALKEKIEIKQKLVEAGIKLDEQEIKYIEQDIKAFKELGMEFVGDVYYSNTKNKKVWGNSKHSCIEYVTAFGSYVFDKSWDIRCVKRGSLEECENYYNEDKVKLENIIKTKYKNHFGFVDQDKFNFKKLLSNLKSVENKTNKLDVEKGSQDDYIRLTKEISGIVKMLEECFEVR